MRLQPFCARMASSLKWRRSARVRMNPWRCPIRRVSARKISMRSTGGWSGAAIDLRGDDVMRSDKARLRSWCVAGLVVFGVAGSGAAANELALRSPGGGEVRALVIGIDDYKHVRSLKGAAADARDIES